ncbi:hypothetical protein [Ralstonia syzygii]|uniref:hypothetical protein n=1 Tax=Ralstonia syzygii TaxID=28097 RepID=UPI0023D9DC03|nr:hypothetical protein [Ralstonia syzygii]
MDAAAVVPEGTAIVPLARLAGFPLLNPDRPDRHDFVLAVSVCSRCSTPARLQALLAATLLMRWMRCGGTRRITLQIHRVERRS